LNSDTSSSNSKSLFAIILISPSLPIDILPSNIESTELVSFVPVCFWAEADRKIAKKLHSKIKINATKNIFLTF